MELGKGEGVTDHPPAEEQSKGECVPPSDCQSYQAGVQRSQAGCACTNRVYLSKLFLLLGLFSHLYDWSNRNIERIKREYVKYVTSTSYEPRT